MTTYPPITVWKSIGETPKSVMQRAAREYGLPPGLKAAYTCRLDPLAQGIMTILFGDSVNQASEYNGKDKIYRFQAILGVCTASYDALGVHTEAREVTYEEAQQYMDTVTQLGSPEPQPQKLPPCSAFRYKGKTLWQHYRDGTLPPVLPSRPVKIYSVRSLVQHPVRISLDQYREECMSDIGELESTAGEFGVVDITRDWRRCRIKYVYRIPLEAHVSSGTYIRGIVHDTGSELGIPAHAFRITRTRTLCAGAVPAEN